MWIPGRLQVFPPVPNISIYIVVKVNKAFYARFYTVDSTSNYNLMPPLQDITNGQVPARKRTLLNERTIRDRRGPKPKALIDRVYKPRGLIKRPTNSYSYTRKVEVLMFCHYHRVQYIDLVTELVNYRPPTL